ncbi:MAG: Rne/Rng family ribonuclease [Pseudomonadota bacterium]|nr:Rne/Rng family ribonuclease [Pseudomonadota bacterium]
MKKILIDAEKNEEVRVAIVDKENLIDYEAEKIKNDRIKGNIYLAKIVRVEPSLQAAFVDYGGNKHGFLAYNEIHPDYFKIPTADKKKLLDQELEESKQISLNDDDELYEDNYQEADNSNKKKNQNYQKGFLSKVFDFFNYKPLDDFSSPKLKRRKNFKTQNQNKKKSVIFHRKYSIQEVIKSNQVILIQVVKEERGNKGAAVTTRLSLAGKYCVLMPNTNKGGGISRKIVDFKLRKKLKETVSKLSIGKGMGVIIRTAGQSMGLKDIKRDYNSLIKLWKEITTKTIKSNAPFLIHEEDNLIKRCLRDYFDSTYDEVLINNKKTFLKCKEIIKQYMPQSVKFLKEYKDKKPLFFKFGIEKKVIDINNPVVNLRSGGYLVINQTEALVAIDINSGRFTKQRNIEDTAFKTNLEAAEEISRQLRIRDLAGLVVIDFIDMLDRNHNYKVEKKLKEFVQGDRARIQIGRISNFGLLELSRQRLKVTEDQKISIKCSHCNGYGNVLSHEFLINQILRVWSEITYDKPKEKIYLLCNSLLNTKLNELKKMNKKDEIPLKTKIHDELGNQEFLICKENEVLIKNSHIDIEIESINEILRNKSYKDQNHDNRKTKNKNKLSEVVKNEVFETDGVVEDSKNEFEKRKSYRAKAKDFSQKKVKKSAKSSTKIQFENQSMDIIKKQKKVEKRQGWWSQ